ncbi:MAG: PDDEXK nuclease domain-containing protein [Dysgonamonadaceae bacterium]|jgi:predicted nuclease of restriction endonuclease-like (RecB) superfamily|nr:PDDEXK nuclease domain-containing protein [Dysgonamonadaceae bacterium]
MKFKQLTTYIQQTNDVLRSGAGKAINRFLTVRNWLIGFYIFEFEQKGEDRAQYGEKLLQSIADVLREKSLSYRNLRLFRKFYQVYPQIGQIMPDFLHKNRALSIEQSPIAKFQNNENEDFEIWQSSIAKSFDTQILVPPEKILSELSYTHLVQLFPIQDPLKRAFYEIECIKGSWSVRELQRQIETLYFERCGMSISPEKLFAQIQNNAEISEINDVIKSPFTFEFLGLKAKDVVEESDIETALITQLQDFLLELGYGFCFEARQKRILVDGEYFFVDLVFYHRILKCHVLVELKNERFKHENIAQLNTYVSYYRHNVMHSGDNPPIGILLCTDKSDELVKYATAGMDNQLFVSKYLIELPKKEEWMKFIKHELSR